MLCVAQHVPIKEVPSRRLKTWKFAACDPPTPQIHDPILSSL